ncbi:MAG: DUF192 domain-containing protein [bacterium]|nr:DUF192 domain-containing protein [bacterium]
MKKFLFLFSISLVVLTAGCSLSPDSKSFLSTSTIVKFNDSEINTYIADEESERNLGLGDIAELEWNQGMLFVYDESDEYSYWMKDVEYPIDIIWLSDDYIVDITENVPPEAEGTSLLQYQSYSPHAPVNRVLEVNAGYVQENNVKIGDIIKIISDSPVFLLEEG